MKKVWAGSLFVIFWLVLPGLSVWWFLNPEDSHVNGFITPPDEEMVNYVLALICYFWMALNIILSSRTKLHERLAPLNLRILAHILMTIGVFVSFTYHAVFKIAVKPDIDVISWSLFILFYLGIIVALSWTPVKGFMWFPRFRMIGYEFFRRIHHLIMLAILVLMVIHLYAAHVFEFSQTLPNIVFFAYGILALVVFVVARMTATFAKKGRIKASERTKSLVRLDIAFDKKHDFQLGQFVYVKSSIIPSLRAYHPFSIMGTSENSISLLVNAKGPFTKSLAELGVGSELMINGSYGSFFKRQHRGPLVFIGTGSGVGVLSGMVHHLLRAQLEHEIFCFFSVAIDDYFRELEALRASKFPNLTLKLRGPGDAYFTKDSIGAVMGQGPKTEVYICSGQKNATAFKKIFVELGIRKSMIHVEKFHY